MRIPRYYKLIIGAVPALAVLPSILVPLPSFRSGVELAGYFQSLALIKDGIESYFYLTPAESSAGLHLHSLVSSPLLAAGILPAGRVISILSAITAAILLGALAENMFNRRVALLSVAFLWANPFFLFLSGAWMPEALGLALTIAALYSAYLRVETGRMLWYTLASVCLFLSIANHTWEAIIALPVTTLYLYHSQLRDAIGVVGVTGAGLATFAYVRSLQPPGHDLIRSYSIFYNYDVLFSLDWLLHGGIAVQNPLLWAKHVAEAVILPLTLLVFAVTVTWYLQTHSENALLLSSWLASGLSIFVLLPAGWIGHGYYAWGVLAPLSIAVAVLVKRTVERGMDYPITDSAASKETLRSVAIVGVAILVVSPMLLYTVWVTPQRQGQVYVPHGDADYTSHSSHPSMEAGKDLAAAGVTNPRNVTFVGDWRDPNNEKLFIQNNAVGRVLLYSGMHVRSKLLTGEGTPRFVDSVDKASECEYMVIADSENGTIRTHPCGI